jgi:hypothetical protein
MQRSIFNKDVYKENVFAQEKNNFITQDFQYKD